MKKYLSYFKVMFIILAVLGCVTGVLGIRYLLSGAGEYRRNNSASPSERVYDYAEVLTDEEEDKLRVLIAGVEDEIGADLVIVTINESVLEKYGYSYNSDSAWEYCIESYADDFYDSHNYGYNKKHGDGALLLDNWYEGELGSEKGTTFSTCGRLVNAYTDYMVDEVLDDVYDLVESNPYRAYKSFVENVRADMLYKNEGIRIPFFVILIISLVVAAIYIAVHLKVKEGKKTTVPSTYVANDAVRFHVRTDDLINRYVTSRVIQTSSGSSGGGSGSRISSGGVRHGGGSRRR